MRHQKRFTKATIVATTLLLALFIMIVNFSPAYADDTERELEEKAKFFINNEINNLIEKRDVALDEAEKCIDLCYEEYDRCEPNALGCVWQLTDCGESCFKTYDSLDKRLDELVELSFQLEKKIKIIDERNGGIRHLAIDKDISIGDVVVTSLNTGAEIDIFDSTFTAAPNTFFRVDDAKDGASISIWRGAMRILDKMKRKPNRKYEIRTPNTILGVRGTDFTVEVTESRTVVQVLEGEVEVTDVAGGKTLVVGTGYAVTVPQGAEPSEPVPFDPETIDPWFREFEPRAEKPFPWLLTALIGAGVVLIAAVVVVLRRRR